MNETSVHEFFSLSGRALPLTVTTYTRPAHTCIFPAHWHQQIELLAVTDGSMRIVCGDTVQVVGQGEVLLVNPYESHLGYAGDEGVSYYCLIAEPSLCGETSQNNPPPRFQNLLTDPTVYSLITAIDKEYRERTVGYELFIRAHLLLIFSHLLRHYQAAAPILHENDVRINNIIRYINTHYADKLSTASIADAFGFSLSYFCRYFKSVTGTTVLEYINAVRLSHACRLLQQTDLPVGEIAHRVGFSGVNYFVRQFHDCIGCSPLQFRKGESPSM